MLFNKNDFISLTSNGKNYTAICVDADTAVFAKVKKNKTKGIHTDYRGLIAFSNLDSIDFPESYKRISKDDVE
jgi:hypothetical protein